MGRLLMDGYECNQDRRRRHPPVILMHGAPDEGKSPGRFIDPSVKRLLQKYSDFQKVQITLYPQPSRSFGGALRNVTNAERGAVDADGAMDESA